MKVSPKKLKVFKFGVTLYPTKVYGAKRDKSDINRIMVNHSDSLWCCCNKKELVFK